jgi:hypothetical protein
MTPQTITRHRREDWSRDDRIAFQREILAYHDLTISNLRKLLAESIEKRRIAKGVLTKMMKP